MHSAPPPVFRVLFRRKLQLSSRRQRRPNLASLHACAIQLACLSAAASLQVSRGMLGCLLLGCPFLGCLPRLPSMFFFCAAVRGAKHDKGLRLRLPCRDTGHTSGRAAHVLRIPGARWSVRRDRAPASLQRAPASLQRAPASLQRAPASLQRAPG